LFRWFSYTLECFIIMVLNLYHSCEFVPWVAGVDFGAWATGLVSFHELGHLCFQP
jgi:hypothetical protein